MIKEIIELLRADNYYSVSPEIEIAKGRFQRVVTWRKARTQLLRMIKSKCYGKEI